MKGCWARSYSQGLPWCLGSAFYSLLLNSLASVCSYYSDFGSNSVLFLSWQDGVFLLPGCCDPFNDKALRAGRGAAFRLPIAVGQWPDLLQLAQLRNLCLLAADPDEASQPDASPGLQALSGSDALARVDAGTVGAQPRNVTELKPHSKTRTSKEVSPGQPLAPTGVCVVLGSEGQGLSETVRASCQPVSIPMPGDMESLNVAVAGGILLFALRKQLA